MKRILALWLAVMLIAVQPCFAIILVGFGQEVSGGGEEIFDNFSTNTSSNYTLTGSVTVSGGAMHGQAWANSRAIHNTTLSSTSTWGSADIQAAGGDYSCIIVGAFRACIFSNDGTVQLQSSTGSDYGRYYNGGYTAGTYNVKLEVPSNGTNIKIYVNSVLVLTTTYSTTNTNTCGAAFSRGSSAADVTVDNLTCDSI